MTPEEVFAQLRDIHAPEAVAKAVEAFDFRPLLVFAAILAVALIARRLMAVMGRRKALGAVDPSAPPAQQRDAMLQMLARTPLRPHTEPAPKAFFDPPDAITDQDVTELRRWAGRRLR